MQCFVEICECEICGLKIKTCIFNDLQAGIPKEFRDLRYQNEPKKFVDLGFTDFNKNLLAHL